MSTTPTKSLVEDILVIENVLKIKHPKQIIIWGVLKIKVLNLQKKIILFRDLTQKEAIEIEIKLHKFYNIDKNDHFANKAKQTSLGFSFSGIGSGNPNHGKVKINNGIDARYIYSYEEIPKGYILGGLPKRKFQNLILVKYNQQKLD